MFDFKPKTVYGAEPYFDPNDFANRMWAGFCVAGAFAVVFFFVFTLVYTIMEGA